MIRTVPAASIAAVLAAAALGAAAPAQAQSAAPSQDGEAIRAILGALFGDQLGVSTSLESEWNRGRRPLSNQRTQFESRIDADVRSGRITRREGERLRDEYQDLVDLEARYTADGRVTTAERSDLTQRYRDFSQRLQNSGSSGGSGGGWNDGGGWNGGNDWVSLSQGRAEFDRRVDAQVSARRITRAEGVRLKADYQSLIQTEQAYQRDGLSRNERQDLETRLSDLNRRVGDNWNSGGGGWGGADNRTRLTNLESAISQAERAGTISRTEAAELRVQHGDLFRIEAAYARLNPTREESDYLTRRIGELEQRARIRR